MTHITRGLNNFLKPWRANTKKIKQTHLIFGHLLVFLIKMDYSELSAEDLYQNQG